MRPAGETQLVVLLPGCLLAARDGSSLAGTAATIGPWSAALAASSLTTCARSSFSGMETINASAVAYTAHCTWADRASLRCGTSSSAGKRL